MASELIYEVQVTGDLAGPWTTIATAGGGNPFTGPGLIQDISYAVYQLMSRLEESKFVEGEDEITPAEGYALRERRYRITGLGERARRETLAFYAEAQASALPLPA